MMKKFSFFLVFLVLVSFPLWTFGEEPADSGQDIHFFVDPVAGPEKVIFELVLRNEKSKAQVFEFPSAQLYEIMVKDSSGNNLFSYSKGKAFAQVLQNVTLGPGEAVSWKEAWDYQAEGRRVPDGEYTVTAELKAKKADGQPIEILLDQKELYVPKENPVFKQVKASGKQGRYVVEGKVRPDVSHFFYTVEDGHHEQIRETRVEAKEGTDWNRFVIELTIPAGKLPESGTVVLHLYERSETGGSISHSYPVILERF
jgi:hypothetical protein